MFRTVLVSLLLICCIGCIICSSAPALATAWPKAIAVSKQDDVYVIESFGNDVQKLNSKGKLVGRLGTAGTGKEILEMPTGIALSPDGKVFVSDQGSRDVKVFNTAGKLLSVRKIKGGIFADPHGIVVNKSGNLYVAVELENSFGVQKFDSKGKFISSWSVPASLGCSPQISCDSKGNIYVSCQDADMIRKYSPSGKLILKWGTKGRGRGQFEDITGISVGADGNVYVCDKQNNNIQVFNASGKFLKWWAPKDSSFDPIGICTDEKGCIYTVEQFKDDIRKFSSSGKLLGSIHAAEPVKRKPDEPEPPEKAEDNTGIVGAAEDIFGGMAKAFGDAMGNAFAAFQSPNNAAIDALGNIYLGDQLSGSVTKLDPSGHIVKVWARQGTDDHFTLSRDALTADPQGYVYIYDSCTGMIDKLDSEGKSVARISDNKSWKSNKQCTAAIAVDSAGSIFLAGDDYKIRKFSSSGDLQLTFSAKGRNPKEDEFIARMIVDSQDNTYMCAFARPWIRKFDAAGKFVTQWQPAVKGKNKLPNISGLVADSAGNIYAAITVCTKIEKASGDYDINEEENALRFVEMFDSHGTSIKKLELPGARKFHHLGAIAVDAGGQLYVPDNSADGDKSYIYIFSKSGVYEKTIEISGQVPAQQ